MSKFILHKKLVVQSDNPRIYALKIRYLEDTQKQKAYFLNRIESVTEIVRKVKNKEGLKVAKSFYRAKVLLDNTNFCLMIEFPQKNPSENDIKFIIATHSTT